MAVQAGRTFTVDYRIESGYNTFLPTYRFLQEKLICPAEAKCEYVDTRSRTAARAQVADGKAYLEIDSRCYEGIYPPSEAGTLR